MQCINENLNTTMLRLNRWARFVRVNDPDRNIGRLLEAVLNIVDPISVPDPCGYGNSDVETGNNIELVCLLNRVRHLRSSLRIPSPSYSRREIQAGEPFAQPAATAPR